MPETTSQYDYVPRAADSTVPGVANVRNMIIENTATTRTNKTAFPENISLAIAYVAFQENIDMYSAEEGLERGTIFPELFKPFTGKRGVLE